MVKGLEGKMSEEQLSGLLLKNSPSLSSPFNDQIFFVFP